MPTVEATSQSDRSPSLTPLSPWTREIVKLAQAGIDDNVVLSFVDTTSGTFNLGADQIICLNELGLSGAVLSAMLQHDSDMAMGLRPVYASNVPESQPSIQLTFVRSKDAATNPESPRGSTSPDRALTVDASDEERGNNSLFAPDAGSWESEYSRLEYSSGDFSDLGRALMWPRRAADRALYPVRDPNPVEITSPIIVLQGWSRTPNTLVIEFRP